jgi:hypothetical protein
MVDRERLLAAARERFEKKWDVGAIKSWFDTVTRDGIPDRGIPPGEAIQRRNEVLDRVQRRAEDCTFLGHI